MAPTVFFRVDAGLEIGSGHVMRSLALAEALRLAGARVCWIMRTRPGDLRRRVESKGFEVRSLPPATNAAPDAAPAAVPPASQGAARREHERWLGVPWQEDALETRRALGAGGAGAIRPDLLVVDHYGIDARWESSLRPHVGRLCVIDDLGDRAHDCDLLVAPAAGLGPSHLRRLVPEYCTILTGASYALIASEFAEKRTAAIARRRARPGGVARIFVGFGGVDRAGLTRASLKALLRVRFEGELDVVLGEEAPHREEVRSFLDEHFQNARLHVAPASIAPLMAEADLAIGAAGVMSWERCAVGLPAVVVCAAANQARVARALAVVGAAAVVAHGGEDPRAGANSQVAGVLTPGGDVEEALARCIGELLGEPEQLEVMSARAAYLCDGLGAARAALALMPEEAGDSKPVSLRPARIADTKLLYEWQTHPSTRRYARRPEPPQYEEHRRWVRRKIRDPLCIFHIVEYDAKPAGVVRLDALEQPRAFEVSIHVDPELKRRGIARAALRAIRRLVPWAEFHAWVLPENEASRRLFESAGYKFWEGRYVERPAGG